MELTDKLDILGTAAKYDVCAASSCSASASPKAPRGLGTLSSAPICHSWTPDGRCVSLFKVLQTNVCKNNCRYCQNRCSNDINRISFTPEELAKTFIEFYKRNYVEGLFLSSGIKGSSAQTMSEMIKTVDIVRNVHHFNGYIHLKVLPGIEPAQIEEAARLATRLSINVEAPTQKALLQIAGEKDLEKDIIQPMALIQQQKKLGRLPGGHTTQFVVGAAGESDQEIMRTTFWLYQKRDLNRAYFSAFINSDAHLSKESLTREHRLYQADFLYRKYKFTEKEIVFNNDGLLDLDLDPKLALALRQPAVFPLEVNKSSYEELLRVPGIGPQSGRRLVTIRREHRFTDLKELKNVGVVIKRAAPFITINGKKQGSLNKFMAKPKQLSFDLGGQFLLPAAA
ncbi:MAG: putative DNA modification/repair radical SAM protein [Candidatus Margulisiibacteriota bacterium]|jgi:putative DNA modification/repair radical SAM protein